jgi:SAM-dependent methyltransferase
MRYLRDPRRPHVALRYLRNKQLDLLPTVPRLGLRVWTRLHRMATRYLNAAHERCVQVAALVGCGPQLVAESAESILDFGGVESTLPLTLCALGYRVTVWDQREYPFTHPNLQTIQRDIFEAQPDPELRFDAVVSVSTIEHLGLGAYGDREVPDGDRRGVAALWSLVRPGGRMIVTVPAGRPAVQRGYRVYDAARLKEVFPDASLVRWFLKGGRTGVWLEVGPADVQDYVYQAPTEPLPIEAVAVIVSDKP